MIRLIQRRLIIPRGDTGTFTVPALSPGQSDSVGVFTIFDPITKTRVFQKQVELQDGVFNIEFDHGDTVNLQAGDYLWDIKFYVNPIIENGKVIDGTEIDSYYAAFQTPKCEIRETGDDFMVIDGQPAKIEDLNIILAATGAANAAKIAATEQAEIAATKASEAAERLAQMIAAIPTKVSELENDSGYLQEETDPTVPAWAKAAEKPSYTPQEVGALPSDTFIPSKVSDLTDDSGHYIKPASGIPASDLEETYLTQHQDISMKANSADLAAVATSGSYEDLSDKPTIPEVPVQDVQINGASALDENGVASIPIGAKGVLGVVKAQTGEGILISSGTLKLSTPSSIEVKEGDNGKKAIVPYNQHDAAFYGLAKAAGYDEKDSELPVGQYTDAAKAAIQQMLDVPSTAAIPTKVSQLQNDSGYLISFTEIDPTVPEWAKAAQKPSYTAAEVGAPTVAEMNTAIGNAIGNINSFDMAVVQELPTQDISTHTIYLVPKTGETNDVYDEYVYINDAWEMVGNTQIDLSDYALKSELPTRVSELSNDAGYLTTHQDISGKVDTSALAAVATSGSYNDLSNKPTIPEVPVQDVQVAGTSILNNNIATIPLMGESFMYPGIISFSPDIAKSGLNRQVDTKTNNPYLSLFNSPDALIKSAQDNFILPVLIRSQHTAVFYGLAKAAGDTTQSQSNNSVGSYTNAAKGAIQKMLGITDLIAPEENDLVANQAYAIGDMFTSGGKLYKATSAIISGGTIIPTTNCVEITVIDALATKLDAAEAGLKVVRLI